MNRLSRAVLTAVLASFLALGGALYAPAAAQEMTAGTWGGTIAPPGGGTEPVSFEVASEDDVLTISILGPQGETLPLNDIELTEEALTFWIDFGVRVICELLPQDGGGYEGECVGDDGQSGVLTMVPPDEG